MSFPTPDAIERIASDRRQDAIRNAAVHRSVASSHRRVSHRAWRHAVSRVVTTLRRQNTARPRRRVA
jgi:hypothetical protein